MGPENVSITIGSNLHFLPFQNHLLPEDIDFSQYIVEDAEQMKEGMKIMFKALSEYYDSLDSNEVREVLIDLVKSGKDAQKVLEKQFPQGIYPESLRSLSVRSPLSQDS